MFGQIVILPLFFATAGVAAQSIADDGAISAQACATDAPETTGIDQMDLLAKCARLSIDQGDNDTAETLLVRLVALREQSVGADHPDTLQSLHDLATVYHKQGRYGKAESIHRSTLAGRERILGKEHPDTLRSVNGLATAIELQGRYTEAETLRLHLVQTRERLLGTEHPDTLSASNNLAVLLADQGRYEEAEPLHLHVLETRKRTLGNEHPDTLGSINNIAILFSMQGRYSEAEPYYMQALDARQRTLGAEHPDTINVMNNLGVIFEYQGRYGEAETLHKKVLEVRSRTIGAEHPKTLASINNLAAVLESQGRYREAEPLYVRALKASERSLGAEHQTTFTLLSNLANLYNAEQRYSEAEPLYLRALQLSEKSAGLDHPDTLGIVNNLADLFQSQGKFDRAKPLFGRAIEARRKVLGPQHPDTLNSIHDMADLLSAQGHYEEAEPLYFQALAGQLRSLKNTDISLADSYEGIGSMIAQRDGDPAKAAYFLKKAVNVLQAIRQNMSDLGSGSQRAFVDKWAESYLRLQKQLVRQGRFAEAEQVGRMFKETEYVAFVRGASDQDGGEKLNLSSREQQWENLLNSWMERPNKLADEIEVIRAKEDAGKPLSPLEKRQLADLEAAYDTTYGEFRTTVNGWLGDVRALADEQVQEEARALELASAERMQGVIADIGPEVALIQFVAFEDSLHIFLTTPKAFKHVAVPVRRNDLFDAIFSARQEIEKARDPNIIGLPEHVTNLRARLGKLYGWLIQPIATDLADAGTKTVMLNLQGQIRYVPFAALWDGESWFTERFRLALFTPAAQTRFDTPTSMRGGAAFGLSNETEGFGALPAVPVELALIMGGDGKRGVLEGDYRLNAQFTRDSFEAALANPAPVVHIASHFAIRPGDEAASFLVLGDGSHLTLAEINRSSKLRFRGVELLTLSACETALGGNGTGMEIEGMGALAQNKGAASVMATLWQVADDTTPEFMRDFYSGVATNNLSKSAALQAAQIKMINSKWDNDPFYWAPFIIMGNWK